MKDLKSYGQFTKIKLKQNMDKRTISSSQKIYFEKALEHADISDSKLVYYPIVPSVDFRKNIKNPADKKFIRLYQSHVVTHILAYMCTRLNLGFAVSTLSRFLSNLTPKHIAAMQRVYQYLQATKDMKIVYRGGLTKHPRLEVYKDVDWAGNKETQKLISAYVAMLSGCSFSWSSKRQTIVAQSSREAEYITASKGTK